jgi:hypothetical protein
METAKQQKAESANEDPRRMPIELESLFTVGLSLRELARIGNTSKQFQAALRKLLEEKQRPFREAIERGDGFGITPGQTTTLLRIIRQLVKHDWIGDQDFWEREGDGFWTAIIDYDGSVDQLYPPESRSAYERMRLQNPAPMSVIVKLVSTLSFGRLEISVPDTISFTHSAPPRFDIFLNREDRNAESPREVSMHCWAFPMCRNWCRGFALMLATGEEPDVQQPGVGIACAGAPWAGAPIEGSTALPVTLLHVSPEDLPGLEPLLAAGAKIGDVAVF